MHRYVLACLLAALSIATCASQTAMAVAQTSDGYLLRLICDARNVKESTCAKAKGYPDGRACNVELQETRAEGHYLSANSTILLVVYQSDCEAHATNNGGSLIFEKRGATVVFKGYQQGLVVTDCTSVAKGTGQEHLICTTGYLGQGHAVTTLSEIVFTQHIAKKVKAALDVLVEATDDSGAYGANRVECKTTFKLFNLSLPKPGPAPNTVLVQAQSADSDLIRKACAPGRKPPTEAIEPAPSGEAYVKEGELREGRFVVDFATRKIAPESAATAK